MNTWDQQRIITDLVVLAGAAFALYCRILGASLKPLGSNTSGRLWPPDLLLGPE